MKGQTAMEYLMTYGWAILIVIVVIAALYSMGVFTLTGGVPCSPCFSNFAYVDHNASTLIITSGPREINIDSITPTLTGYTNPISAGTRITLTGTIGDPQDVTITYTVTDSGIQRTDSATLRAV